MNKSFKSIWNEALGAWVAASELDRARGKRVASSSRAPEQAVNGGAATHAGMPSTVSPRRLAMLMASVFLGCFRRASMRNILRTAVPQPGA